MNEGEVAKNASETSSELVTIDKHDGGIGQAEAAKSKLDSDPECDAESSASDSPHLSKNQLKKLKKRERWMENKSERRRAEKLKRKKKLAEMKERGEEMIPSRKSLKRKKMVDSACQQRVVIDCSFDDFMSEKDTSFLVQQIQHSYAANRRAINPVQLYVTSIRGKAKQRLDKIGDYKGWDIHKKECNYIELFKKEELVYLSSESPNVLQSMDASKVYVIGGLVDHNHHKGLCYLLAQDRGLAHAQLPIGQFLLMKTRKVLTINHVFEILLRYTETQNWEKSMLAVLPQRKGVTSVKDGEKKAEATKEETESEQAANAIMEETKGEMSAESEQETEDTGTLRDTIKTDTGTSQETETDTGTSQEIVETDIADSVE